MTFTNRYLITLLSTIIRAGLNFIVSISVARYLMPEQYGDYQYIVSIVTGVLIFASMGMDKAYFTFISEEKKPLAFHMFYYSVQLFQVGIVIGAFMLLSPNIIAQLIHDIDQQLIVLAFIALFLSTSVQSTIIHVFESIRQTIYPQVLNIVIALLHLVLILYLIREEFLTIGYIFYMIILEYSVYIALSLIIFKSKKFHFIAKTKLSLLQTMRDFYTYSKPLIIFMFLALLYTVFDRWLIQKYVGSEGQAFFSIAIQFSALSILVSSSILKIFWKEIAEAIKVNNKDKVKAYFSLISQDIFIFTVMTSTILYFFSEEIIYHFYGDAYQNSLLVFQLIMLYTIPQSLGQLYATYFMATSQTSLYTKISYGLMAVTFPLSYYLLSDIGLGLDQSGIAFKMVLMNVVSITILEYFIARDLGIKMTILKKLFIVGIFMLISYIIYRLTVMITDNFLIQVLLVSSLYVFPIMVYLFKELKKGI